MQIKTVNGLKAPTSYWHISEGLKQIICNGAGPKGWGWLVPDTIYGLSITEAANIHDYCYYTKVDKKDADNLFFENMHALIDRGNFFLKPLRQWRAFIYYLVVKHGGRRAYQNSRTKIDQLSRGDV